MFKNIIKITTLTPLRYFVIQEHLKKKVMRDVILNLNKKETYYVNTRGIITYNLFTIKKIKEPIIQGVSGIYQTSLNYNTQQASIEVLAKMVDKYIFTIYGGAPITSIVDLFLRIELFFKSNNILDHPAYFPLGQHMIVSNLANFNCPINVLESLTENLVDYSFFKNNPIPVISCTEAIVTKNTLLSFSKNYKDHLEIIAINPEHKAFQDTCLSYKQSKQPFMDLFLKYSVETEQNKHFYLDSKLIADPINMLSLTRGYMSLVTSINFPILKNRFKAACIESSRQKNAPIKEQQLIKDYLEPLEKVFRNKNLTLQEKIDFFIMTRNHMLFDPKITTIIPSIITIPSSNEDYKTSLMENIGEYTTRLKQIEDILKEDNCILLQDLIPYPNNQQQAHVELWHAFLLKIIKKYPEPKKTKLLENYHKFKLLEYDTDF